MNISVETQAKNARAFSLLLPRSFQTRTGLFVLISTAVAGLLISQNSSNAAATWVIANVFGFTLQRSRFCFASAFRDLFLFGSGHTMKGIIVGIGVSTIGFAAIMSWIVPNANSGTLPSEAHILPVGISVIVGGILFGIGMVVAGGCVSGSLYRMAEGYVASWITIGGVILGLAGLTMTWNWWWDFTVSTEPKIWLPSSVNLGYTGAIAVTLIGLILLYLLVIYRENMAGIFNPHINTKAVPVQDFQTRVRSTIDPIFIRGWNVAVGGATLGLLGIVLYTIHKPLGVTGELMRASQLGLRWAGVDIPVLNGLSTLGGCTGILDETGLITHTFAITVGLLPGALIGALFAGEFRLRLPKNWKRYVQSLGGGLLMGYAAGLAIGCTVGAFFSAIPSLSLSGWIFGIALAIGAFTGTQVIKRIS